ncbi:conjugal transfer protein [Sutcliffiella rhizosphaerae]|uniref:conjugal transfer protein n=1 Tax=Sutcliffiella rhizosphaerae TaxID=2880967 RepID=UPI001E359903|nr:conjugal transfer protein [Sutcliffiella rhizosphaerae]
MLKEKKGASKVKEGKASGSKREISFSKRKTKRIASFLVFGIMFVSLLFNVIHFSKVQTIRNTVQASYDEIEQQVKGAGRHSLLETPLLIHYSTDFIREYFEIPADEEERNARKDRLKHYFVSGFDVNSLEDMSEFIGSRSVQSIDLMDIRSTDTDEVQVQYLVTYQVIEQLEEEKEVVTTEVDKDGEEKEVTQTVLEEIEKSTDYQVEVIIPVVTDGEGFAVTRHLTLLSSDIKSVIQYEPLALKGEDLTSQQQEALSPFLRDFLTSFGQSDEKLAFMASVDRGLLDKVYEDHSIVESVRQNGVYSIRLHVNYREEQTSLTSRYFYEIHMKEENGRFFVESIH